MFLFLFLNYREFYFLIPAVIANIFNPITELVIPIETPIKEEKAEIKMHPVIAETKIRKCAIYIRGVLISSFRYISSRK